MDEYKRKRNEEIAKKLVHNARFIYAACECICEHEACDRCPFCENDDGDVGCLTDDDWLFCMDKNTIGQFTDFLDLQDELEEQDEIAWENSRSRSDREYDAYQSYEWDRAKADREDW